MAEEVKKMSDMDISDELKRLEELTGVDVLQPFGKLPIYEDNEAANVDEEPASQEVATSSGETAPISTAVITPGGDNDESLDTELDVEELASTVLKEGEAVDGSLPSGSKMGMCYLDVGGKQRHKASLCRIASADFHVALSTDRLKRVRAQRRYDTKPENILDGNDGSESLDYLVVNDPVVTLIAVDSRIFLAVGKTCTFKTGDSRLSSIPISQLNDPSVSASIQIMVIIPREPTDSDGSDWVWNGKVLDKNALIVSGEMILPINPVMAIGESEKNEPGGHELRFDTKTLLIFAQELMQRTRNVSRTNIPHMSASKVFPYRYNGKCFVYW